jgi:hypothetical protein
MTCPWTEYVKEWVKFERENPMHPLLNLCYEDMKKVTNHHPHDAFKKLQTHDFIIFASKI